MSPARRELMVIGVAVLAASLAAGSALAAYVAAGGTLDRASSTQISLLSPREWGFDTLVGCGPGGSTYLTRVGPLQVSRHFGR